MNKKMSKAKCKYGKPNIIEVGNGEKCLLKGRLCFEVVSTCDILKAYEQGRKEILEEVKTAYLTKNFLKWLEQELKKLKEVDVK